MDKKRTLLITTPYFPPYGGGLERYAYEIAKRLASDHNWRVIVVTSGEYRGADKIENVDGLKVYRLAYSIKVSNTPFSFSWFGKLRRIIAEENPEVINIHMPVPGIGDVASCYAGERRVVVTYHAGSMRKRSPIPDLLVWIYENWPLRRLLQRANRIVCSSDFVRNEFLKKYNEKSITVTPGVDTTIFKPDEGKKAKEPTVLFVAGLNRSEQHKGLSSLLRAMRVVRERVRDARLVVVGDGDMKEGYKKRAEELGLGNAVTFTGRLAGPSLAEQYQRAHVFVLPSTNESFSMVILEAMSSGLPIVATRVGGIPTLVDDGKTGFLVNMGDPQGLSGKIISILLNEASSKSFGVEGRKRAISEFGWPWLSKRYNDSLSSPSTGRVLNIVQVAAYYPPHLGGLERVVQEVSEQLARDGYAVTVLTSDYGAKEHPRVEAGLNITIKRLWSFEFAHTAFIPELLYQLLRTKKPAVFHLHLAQAFVPEMVWLAAKLRNIPYVVHFHLDVEPSGPLGFIYVWWKRWIQTSIINDAAYVITLSPDQSKLIEERYGKPKEQVVFIGNGVGNQFLEIGKAQRNPHTPLYLLFLGRLARQKRPERLVEAMSLMKSNATLEMVGDGEDRAQLEELVKKLNLKNVTFRGRLDGEALLDAYRNADVFVLPSDREGMSLALLEAMGTGLPIIGSDVLGIHELIDGVGVLVKDPSPETFARAIDGLFRDGATNLDVEKLKALSAASFEVANRWSWESLVRKLESLYREIVK